MQPENLTNLPWHTLIGLCYVAGHISPTHARIYDLTPHIDMVLICFHILVLQEYCLFRQVSSD